MPSLGRREAACLAYILGIVRERDMAARFEALVASWRGYVEAGRRDHSVPASLWLLNSRVTVGRGIAVGVDFISAAAAALMVKGKGDHLVRDELVPARVIRRLDRAFQMNLDEPFGGAPAEFSLKEYADQIFGTYHEEPDDIRIRFDPSVADAARNFRFHGSQQFVDLEDGSLEVRFRAGGLLEIARHIFAWGGTAEVLEPARLRGLLLEQTDAVARRHHGSG